MNFKKISIAASALALVACGSQLVEFPEPCDCPVDLPEPPPGDLPDDEDPPIDPPPPIVEPDAETPDASSPDADQDAEPPPPVDAGDDDAGPTPEEDAGTPPPPDPCAEVDLSGYKNYGQCVSACAHSCQELAGMKKDKTCGLFQECFKPCKDACDVMKQCAKAEKAKNKQ